MTNKGKRFKLKVGGAGKMEAALKNSVTTMRSANEGISVETDKDALESLRQTGKTLKRLFNITPEKINKAIEEVRKEWK